MKAFYECSQGKGVKWFTAIFFLVIVGAILYVVYLASQGTDSIFVSALLVCALLLIVAFSCFLIFPMYIIVDDESIGIRTLLRTKRIPYETIDHIERVGEENKMFGFTNTIRLCGVGGVFGYIGWFRMSGIGTFYSYVTDPKKAFLIYRMKGLPIAISVKEPDKFSATVVESGRRGEGGR